MLMRNVYEQKGGMTCIIHYFKLFQILGISYILYVIQDITRIYVETPTSACDVERVISNRLLTQELEAAKSPTRSHRVATILGHVELNTQMHGGCCATLPQI